MTCLTYKEDILHFNGKSVLDIARKHATPFYLYSEEKIINNLDEYKNSLKDTESLICYSVKANSSLYILSLLSQHGCGFDIVSGGELLKIIQAGGDTNKVVFSGVGKTKEEIIMALEYNIYCFNVESISELKRINTIAHANDKQANIAVRVNPEISIDSHPYITTGMRDNKFGVTHDEAIEIYKQAVSLSNINIIGIDFHIGSQITDTTPFEESIVKALEINDFLKQENISISHIDIGGGLGIKYENENISSISKYIEKIRDLIGKTNLKLLIEPGRSIVGNSAVLVTRIEYIKKTKTKNFIIVDAGMNDFIRPPLYDAYHSINEVVVKEITSDTYDVVGPICESTDFFGKQREIKAEEGDFLVIDNVGAYGFVLSSNYNQRRRPSELMVIKDDIKVIRTQESYDQLFSNEIKNV
ncbi:MAG: diaminopimelate decarboxylase [Gammaproteobacteria bacterium]|nr:diaminopimelate decarboxylase [Gammaproteobacteria bacterium]